MIATLIVVWLVLSLPMAMIVGTTLSATSVRYPPMPFRGCVRDPDRYRRTG
jgi:hypothetical protein